MFTLDLMIQTMYLYFCANMNFAFDKDFDILNLD